MERIIFHCDLNSFYASVELLDHPELRHLPVAVCGDPESRHGIILAKNEPAKKFRVQTAETIWQAKRKCPDLVLLPAHHRVYREFSRRINRMYQDYTDLVEPFGIDESWLDVSGTLHLFGGDPTALADEIRRRMRQEFGLTISVGVSFNKVFAKLGSGNTFARNLTGREEFQAGVGMLAGQVAARLRRHRMKCTGVALQIRDPDFRDLSRQKRLEVPTCLGREIARAAMELAEGCWTMERPVRALTVTAIALIPEEEASVQQTLFSGGGEEKRARLERLARTTDAIRAKYGPGAIGMASEPRDAARERHAPPPSGAGRGED